MSEIVRARRPASGENASGEFFVVGFFFLERQVDGHFFVFDLFKPVDGAFVEGAAVFEVLVGPGNGYELEDGNVDGEAYQEGMAFVSGGGEYLFRVVAEEVGFHFADGG